MRAIHACNTCMPLHRHRRRCIHRHKHTVSSLNIKHCMVLISGLLLQYSACGLQEQFLLSPQWLCSNLLLRPFSHRLQPRQHSKLSESYPRWTGKSVDYFTKRDEEKRKVLNGKTVPTESLTRLLNYSIVINQT